MTSASGDTVKRLWTLNDGNQIESVLMHYPERSTVCISSQAGCAMACDFCATGQAGYSRNLTVGEILEQIIAAKNESAPAAAFQHRLHGDGGTVRQLRPGRRVIASGDR
ncbi:MAG: hypothetical protein R2706_07830 [Acidimicrobiales bacterium]